jgi:predicted metal-dependent phosphoesterase TrpH
MLVDLHLHTLVSDGELTPRDLLWEAVRHGIGHVSITDHDALGAYAWEDGAVFEETRRLGLTLTVGIELDADMDGLEVHLLGYDVSLDDRHLRAHLDSVRQARFERARREIGIVNGLLGRGSISEDEIFVPGRQTLMKPHFIHPLLDRGRFATYEEANAWYKRNVKAGVAVPKPPLRDAIALVHGAGGWATLAHPGYYEKAGVPMAAHLPALKEMGLDGVELTYPYHACSPHVFGAAEEAAFIAAIRTAGEALGLRFTRGSDIHTSADFAKVYGATEISGP